MYIWNEYIEQKKIQKKPLDTKGMVWLKYWIKRRDVVAFKCFKGVNKNALNSFKGI
jgi:hypothetical protein